MIEKFTQIIRSIVLPRRGNKTVTINNTTLPTILRFHLRRPLNKQPPEIFAEFDMPFILHRVWKKPQNIYDCCRLLCQIQFILGCSGIRSSGGSGKYVCDWISLSYTALAVSCTLATLGLTAYVKFQDPYLVEMDSLIKSIIYLELSMSLFMYITTTTMVAEAKTHLQLYKRINDLDLLLIREFGCNMNYKVLIMKHLQLLGFTTAIYLIIIVLGITRATDWRNMILNLLSALAYICITGGPTLNFFIQMNFAEVLGIRFRLLQKLLKSKPPNIEEGKLVEHFQKLIDLVEKYHDCIRMTNQIFSKSLIIIMLHDFTLTTSELYLIFGGLTGSGSNALIYFVLLGLVLPIYKMTVGPVYSENAIKEDLDFHYRSCNKIRDMVAICLTWRWDNKIPFTSGSMPLNMETIAGVYVEIFNYILILIQFRMTQEMGDQIEKQKNTIQDWIGLINSNIIVNVNGIVIGGSNISCNTITAPPRTTQPTHHPPSYAMDVVVNVYHCGKRN
ncbi:putative gustatory receptor 57a [Musca vetustissima]|uniref:putative gustatory receptor 57a n=1 Tax=Musca vetustissima TaxID=27455 RepID=UPI002AB7741A|nr:putative gustatory receptor 57a [Musca vetustissima]